MNDLPIVEKRQLRRFLFLLRSAPQFFFYSPLILVDTYGSLTHRCTVLAFALTKCAIMRYA